MANVNKVRRRTSNIDWGGDFTPREHHEMRSRLAAAYGAYISRGGVVRMIDTDEPIKFSDDNKVIR